MQVPDTVPAGYPEYLDPLRDECLTVVMKWPAAGCSVVAFKIDCFRWRGGTWWQGQNIYLLTAGLCLLKPWP